MSEKQDKYWFVRQLRDYRGMLTKQQIKSIRGMALSGNIVQAEKNLATALKKYPGLNR